MSEYVYAGLTSQTIDLFLGDSSSSTGEGLTGLEHDTSSLTAYYRKGATGSATSISLATQTVGGAYSSGGFKEIDATNMPGVYRLDLPNAAVDTEGFVTVYIQGAADLVPTVLRIDCRPVPVDVKKILGTLITETSSGNLAGNISQFYDLDSTTTNTVDDVGSGGGGDATEAKQDTIISGLLDAAGVRSAVGMASANLDTQIGTLATASALTTVGNNVVLVLADTNELQTNQANWATATGFSTHSAADVRTEIDSNSTQLTAIVADTNELQTNQGSWATATGFSTHSASDVTTDIDSNSTKLTAIVADTNELQGNQANWATATGFSTHSAADVRTEIDSNSTQLTAIVADTNELQTNQSNWTTATGFSTHSASDVRTEIDSNSTQLTAIVADTNELQTNQGAWATATGFSTHSAADVIGYDMGNGRTVEEALYFLRNKWVISDGTLTVYQTDDATESWSGPVTQTAGNPVSGIDPT